MALADRGQVDEAIAHYRKALEIKPDYAEAHNNLGVALAGRGQVDEAIAHYRKALEIKPDYAEAHNNLGIALAGRGQVDEAIAHYRKALEIKPDYAEAHNNLGNALAGRGQVDEAIAHYRKALEIKPDYAEAHYNLGNALGRPRTGRRGDRPLPEGPGNQARLRRGPLQPRHRLGRPRTGRRGDRPLPEGPGNQARLRARPTTTSVPLWPAADRLDEAIAHYRKALEIKPDYAEAHNNLGSRLGRPRTGRRGHRPLPEGPGNQARLRGGPLQPRRGPGRPRKIDEALDHFQKALDLASARNDRAMVDAIRARIGELQ